ncbi:DNA-directed RNA polymerase subunit M [Fervidicoccus fontis]|nr:zf-TFIIB domain-containing protein [Fervidicoccus fontis]MBE9391041.1 DNA-directed RNA polymerase subunit M [Fervidicoccus fontis]PMB76077.1 MAG: DNA-directed RNA polymerase subunit M [Fervidicoccus fontis]PMB77685.1 MAG: DNA-directed RNA polymerase subunit M [Fervidicoccus fontis]HEW63549.1 DNA-directed RNA polymerase subunit M [Fervidicoccus fontis]
MQFCPKCGGIMVPVKKDGETVLRCTKCGYEMKAKKKESYVIKEKVKEKDKPKTTSLVSEPSKFGVSDEEQQQRVEDYYEIALELMQEESEGSDEGEQ